MKLSIIIPVFNEHDTILEILRKVQEAKLPIINKVQIEKEIIIVDDFSTDGTKEILKKIKSGNTKIFYHKKNFGKGMALRTGFKESSGDIILIQDADMEYDPVEYSKLLTPILNGKSVVYGSRLKSFHLKIKDMYFLHYFGNVFLTFLTNILYGTGITDMETGYKVFRKKVIKNMKLKSKRFDIEPEITAKILKRGYKIYEVPINFNPRKFEEGKKITWKDGLKAAWYLFKYRFVN